MENQKQSEQPQNQLQETKGAAKRKELEAFIEALVMQDAALKTRATVAGIYGFLQMPDQAFGWVATKDDEGRPIPMPEAVKLLVIATTIKNDLEVGAGHINWLGSGCYITVAAARYKAAQDPNWKPFGEPKYRPFTADERAMFGLHEKDLACALELQVETKGKGLTFIGHGIIPHEQLGTRMPGRGNRKDAAMTLKTFAERDIYKRNYSVGGLKVAAPEEFDEIRAQTIEVPRVSGKEEMRALAEDDRTQLKALGLREAQDAFTRELRRLTGEKGLDVFTIEDILGQTLTDVFHLDSAEKVRNLVDVLADLNGAQADSLPPPPPKRGRPPKAAVPASEVKQGVSKTTYVNVLEGEVFPEVACAVIPEFEEPGPKTKTFLNPGPKEMPAGTIIRGEPVIQPPRSTEPRTLENAPPPPPRPGAKAYQIITRLQTDKVPPCPDVLERLMVLKGLNLKSTDDIMIAQGARLGDKGNFGPLDDLISRRKGTPAEVV